MYYVGTCKFLNSTKNIDYFLVVFFFAGAAAGFLLAPFDVFAEVPHFFIAITNHPLSSVAVTKMYNEITNFSVKPFLLHHAHSSDQRICRRLLRNPGAFRQDMVQYLASLYPDSDSA